MTALESDMEELMAGIETLNTNVSALLSEARIMNQYLYELPRALNEGTNTPSTDDPETLRKTTENQTL